MSEAIGVGSTIWRFDVNRREYEKGPYGIATGGPIYRAHWRPVVITGETSRSWIVGPRGCWGKAPKNGVRPNWAFTAAEIDDYCWVNSNRFHVVRLVERCTDAEKLRTIAGMVGWKEAR